MIIVCAVALAQILVHVNLRKSNIKRCPNIREEAQCALTATDFIPFHCTGRKAIYLHAPDLTRKHPAPTHSWRRLTSQLDTDFNFIALDGEPSYLCIKAVSIKETSALHTIVAGHIFTE